MTSIKKLPIFLYFLMFSSLMVASYFDLCPHTSYRPKIYDCFLFFNELEILELRLNEMNKGVDYFVIVESAETFRGKEKPMIFAENRDRFETFKDKIIYVPLKESYVTEDVWERERYQRSQVVRGLKHCHNKDIIILSDVDEIIAGNAVDEIVEKLSSRQSQAIVCEQKMYFGYLNRYQTLWRGSVAMPYGEFKQLPVKLVRRVRTMKPKALRKSKLKRIAVMENAGWHFTSMGGVARYLTKIESYSHANFDNPHYKSRDNILQMIESHTLVEIDETFPRFVRENQQHFKNIGFIEE